MTSVTGFYHFRTVIDWHLAEIDPDDRKFGGKHGLSQINDIVLDRIGAEHSQVNLNTFILYRSISEPQTKNHHYYY
jgi:hypothetical protein